MDFILSLFKQADTKDNICYRCGRQGHYAVNCYAKTHHLRTFCFRCGRQGHWSPQCYATTHFNGTALSDPMTKGHASGENHASKK